ncbi:MAG: hypothetical protein AAFP69_17760 [Planctomycetota bacterium]
MVSFVMGLLPIINLLFIILLSFGMTIGSILIIVKAFEDDTVAGVLCILLPLYQLIYCIRTFPRCALGLTIISCSVCGILVAFAGFALSIFLIGALQGP